MPIKAAREVNKKKELGCQTAVTSENPSVEGLMDEMTPLMLQNYEFKNCNKSPSLVPNWAIWPADFQNKHKIQRKTNNSVLKN